MRVSTPASFQRPSAGGTAYWVATLDDWQTWEIGPTTEFVVSLEADGAATRSGPIVLSADLGS